MCVCALHHSVVSDSVTPWTGACQVPLSLGFSRQEYWNRLPFPPLGDLPDAGVKPASPMSLHWQVDSLPMHTMAVLGILQKLS